MKMPRSRSGILAIALLLAAILVGTGAAVTAQAEPTIETPAVLVPSRFATGWQVSAPRLGLDTLRAGDPIELGLRQRYAGPSDQLAARVEVIDPRGASASATLQLAGDEWAYLHYPAGFDGAAATTAGVYQVRYLVGDQPIATDTFAVE